MITTIQLHIAFNNININNNINNNNNTGDCKSFR